MEKRTFVKLNENSAFGDRYNLSFILQVVDDVENGRISKEECKRKYGIKGNTTVLNWLRKYGKLFDQDGIAIRTGHHCAQPVMDRFGIPATARASLAFYNTIEELDALAAGLRKVAEVFA